MLDINVYDMLVFEDENGNIYQDCVYSIEKENIYGVKTIHCNTTVVFSAGDNSYCFYEKDNGIKVRGKLKEVWSRVDEDTYKKKYVWSDMFEQLIPYRKGYLKVLDKIEELEMENKDYTDLLKYFITRHTISVQLVPVDEALKIGIGKNLIIDLMCKDKEYVYVIENQYGEKEVVTDKIGTLLIKAHNEIIRGIK